jgi:hypothetical protein
VRSAISRLSALSLVIAVAIGVIAFVNRSNGNTRSVRLGTVRSDRQPVAEDSDGEHDVLLASGCGTERWPVKTGTDANRNQVNTTPIATTITYLGSRPKPSSYPNNNRIAPYELHTYQVTAYVTQYKLEADSDIHLVLKDTAGRQMIAEIPRPTCVGLTSRWRTAITNARSAWVTHYSTTTTWHFIHRSVTLRGLAFFDVPHGQTGKAPNAIELHPVINVHLN